MEVNPTILINYILKIAVLMSVVSRHSIVIIDVRKQDSSDTLYKHNTNICKV